MPTTLAKVLMAEATDYRGSTHVGSHAIAREFLEHGSHVMWVGTPLNPGNFLVARNDPQVARRVVAWREGGIRVNPSLLEYYPLTLLPAVDRPFLRSRYAVTRTLDATIPSLASILRRSGFDEPDVLWLSNSRFSHAMLRIVRAGVRACRISDDWAHFGTVPPALLALHNEMVDTVDVVFATSRRLVYNLRERRPDALYLPNGVANFFFDEPGPEPGLIAQYPHPRVVFVGKLDAWVDYATIARVGERIPAASVIVVGPGTPARRTYPANVHFPGPFPYDHLPGLLAGCDVGIVPFVRNDLTHSVSPLKLFEYLAVGLPVVATRLDEIEATGAPVLLCNTADEFADAVVGLLDGDKAGRAERRDFARAHTWARRFETIKQTLQESARLLAP